MSDTEKSPLEFKPLGKRGINLTGEAPIEADPLPEADDLADLLEEDEARLTPDMLADSVAEPEMQEASSPTDSDAPSPTSPWTETAVEAAPVTNTIEPALPMSAAPQGDYAIDSLGGSLRQARERLGYQIPDIADHLRIRKAHLSALEQEAWDELPGTVYVIGYLRSYGDFLGLDPQALIDRYKSGDHGPLPANDLSFPSPQKESRLPKWPMIAATLVAGAVGFGFWSDWNAEKAPVETVMQAPGQEADGPDNTDEQVELSTAAEQAQTPAVEAEGETSPAATPTVIAATTPPAAPQASGNIDTPVDAEDLVSVPGDDEVSSTEAAITSVAEEVPADISVTAAGEAAASATTTTVPASEESIVANTVPANETIRAPTIGVSEANAAPSETGLVGGDSRITLIGRHDAWIQISDASGEVLAARLLRKDERYHVPDLIGLKLVTGNAGGLEVAVDGRPGKSLGPIGGVLRDLVLDADALKAE